jgi:DNA-binding transcriptional LysR family regulator
MSAVYQFIKFIVSIYVMHGANLSNVDLNLLVIFEALLAERSAVRAGHRLGLSQPAVSHALARLRRQFADPLFVRAARGLTPTPRALELAPALAEILSATRRMLAPQGFVAAESRRTFTIGIPDYPATMLLPGVLVRLRREAPGITLLVRQCTSANAFELLENGRVDMAIGNFLAARPPLATRVLFNDDLICALRQDHPALSAPWTLERWLGLDHLNVSLAGEPQGYVDEVLARQGAHRRIVATVGHFLLAPHLLPQTDLVATEPRGVLAPLAAPLGLALRSVPFKAPGFAISLAWHARIRDDEGYRWLQNVLMAEATRICGTEERAEYSGR